MIALKIVSFSKAAKSEIYKSPYYQENHSCIEVKLIQINDFTNNKFRCGDKLTFQYVGLN